MTIDVESSIIIEVSLPSDMVLAVLMVLDVKVSREVESVRVGVSAALEDLIVVPGGGVSMAVTIVWQRWN